MVLGVTSGSIRRVTRSGLSAAVSARRGRCPSLASFEPITAGKKIRKVVQLSWSMTTRGIQKMTGQNTSHAVMAQRYEAKDSLDDFPTPPWANRGLLDYV